MHYRHLITGERISTPENVLEIISMSASGPTVRNILMLQGALMAMDNELMLFTIEDIHFGQTSFSLIMLSSNNGVFTNYGGQQEIKTTGEVISLASYVTAVNWLWHIMADNCTEEMFEFMGNTFHAAKGYAIEKLKNKDLDSFFKIID